MAEGNWVTINGNHVLIEDGKIVKGSKALLNKDYDDYQSAKSKEKSGIKYDKERIVKDVEEIEELSAKIKYMIKNNSEDSETAKAYTMELMLKLESVKKWAENQE